MTTPYDGLERKFWAAKTKSLGKQHPLNLDEVVKVVLSCWDAIFESQIGTLRIGKDIFPTPQTMGLFLHELIPDEFERRHPKKWRKARSKADKDMVYVRDNQYSVEIKTSSHQSQIFGNRSYAQPDSGSGKPKAGYYIAVNFQKFGQSKTAPKPKIEAVRFGWIDHTDWIAQKAPTGQQARLGPETYKLKFLTLYDRKRSAK